MPIVGGRARISSWAASEVAGRRTVALASLALDLQAGASGRGGQGQRVETWPPDWPRRTVSLPSAKSPRRSSSSAGRGALPRYLQGVPSALPSLLHPCRASRAFSWLLNSNGCAAVRCDSLVGLELEGRCEGTTRSLGRYSGGAGAAQQRCGAGCYREATRHRPRKRLPAAWRQSGIGQAASDFSRGPGTALLRNRRCPRPATPLQGKTKSMQGRRLKRSKGLSPLKN